MKRFLAALLVAFAPFAWGQAEEIANPDPVVESRLRGLAEELRCLVCQNQTIADSHAPLALDLRNQIRTQIAAGRSDEQIRAYMVDRYGDFVLYNPPFKPTTLLLWVGPFALGAVGIGLFVAIVRKRRKDEVQPVAALDAAKSREMEALLREPRD